MSIIYKRLITFDILRIPLPKIIIIPTFSALQSVTSCFIFKTRHPLQTYTWWWNQIRKQEATSSLYVSSTLRTELFKKYTKKKKLFLSRVLWNCEFSIDNAFLISPCSFAEQASSTKIPHKPITSKEWHRNLLSIRFNWKYVWKDPSSCKMYTYTCIQRALAQDDDVTNVWRDVTSCWKQKKTRKKLFVLYYTHIVYVPLCISTRYCFVSIKRCLRY